MLVPLGSKCKVNLLPTLLHSSTATDLNKQLRQVLFTPPVHPLTEKVLMLLLEQQALAACPTSLLHLTLLG